MTDPERLSQGGGFVAELLRASADEQPSEAGRSRTLAALGLSGAVLATAAGASAATAGGALATSGSGAAALSAGAATSSASGAVSAALLVKWLGIGVVGGVSLAGAAAAVTRSEPPSSVARSVVAGPASSPAPSSVRAQPVPAVAEARRAPEPSPSSSAPLPRPSRTEPAAPATALDDELGVPLSAEVTFVDRGRALLRAGRALEGLSLLEGYEREFSEARLLPEVLFLRLEAYEQLGRTGDARRTAERLLRSFPSGPHAARARKSLGF